MAKRKRVEDLCEQFDDDRLYPDQTHDCSDATKGRALDAAETLLALVAAGKLDATDLRIIEERSRSPMPSNREVAAIVSVSEITVRRSVSRVKALMRIGLHQKTSK